MFVQDQNQAWLNFYPVYLLLGCSLRTILFRIVQGYVTVQLSKFCLLFCDSVLLSYDSFYTLSHLFVSVKRFFNFFSKPFFQNLYPLADRLKGVCRKFGKLLNCVNCLFNSFNSLGDKRYITPLFRFCQHLFLFFSRTPFFIFSRTLETGCSGCWTEEEYS